MGYPQGYTRLEGYDSTKNYPFTLPFPTKITLLHIKKITLLHYLMCILPNIPYFIIHYSFTKTKIREKAHSHLVVLKILSQENHKFIPQNIRFKNNIVRSNILMPQI